MEDTYKQLLEFLHESEKLKSTLRHNWMTSGRQEDSSQHSWRSGIFFVILQELFGLDCDPYKTLVMLIFHDMSEIAFGDIAGFIKDTNPQEHRNHKLREKEAAKKLFSTLPKPLDEKFIKLFEEFEKGESKEARVAQAIEKIESQLQHLESGPKYWSEEEKGEHMLHYPDKAIATLDNQHIRNIWKIIYNEIYMLTYPENKKS